MKCLVRLVFLVLTQGDYIYFQELVHKIAVNYTLLKGAVPIEDSFLFSEALLYYTRVIKEKAKY